MANNYLESSFSISLLSQKEIDWWNKEGYREKDEDLDSQDMTVDNAYCNDWERIDDGSIWFHGEESLDVDAAALVIQRFLRDCRPDGCVGLTYAVTCSKPRLDEFDGGGIFITSSKIKTMNGYSWIQEQINKFNKMNVIAREIDKEI